MQLSSFNHLTFPRRILLRQSSILDRQFQVHVYEVAYLSLYSRCRAAEFFFTFIRDEDTFIAEENLDQLAT